MPLDRDEWAKGRRVSPLERSVLEFLKKNKDKAYTPSEVAESIYELKTTSVANLANMILTVMAVESSLKQLTRDGSVQSKQIGASTYYIAA